MVRLGVPIPADQKSRMKLLSKAWSIRPMSYKQFSNMVSGKNEIYKALVKRNGAADPLRKTLIIIDEAHKLYGEGGLPANEKPDMNAFSEAVSKSYEVSGSDSVRLLIMTATPITTSPMEFVKLLNLCRERFHRIDDTFEMFASTYLNESGMFSAEGRARFLDEIAGYVSYLNREKDARSFAQPIVRYIMTPILQTPLYRMFDPTITNMIFKNDLNALEKKLHIAVEQKNTAYENIKAESFDIIKRLCEQYSGDKRLTTTCSRLANATIKQIMEYIKQKRAKLNETVKNVREQIADLKQTRREIISEIRIKIKAMKNPHGDDSSISSEIDSDEDEDEGEGDDDDEDDDDEFDKRRALDLSDDIQKYAWSTFHAIQKKCKDPPKRAVFNDHPKIVKLTNDVKSDMDSVKKTDQMLKTAIANLKASEKEIRRAIHSEKDKTRKAALQQMLAKKIADNKIDIQKSKKMASKMKHRFTHKVKEGRKEIRQRKRDMTKDYKKYIKQNKKEQKKAEKDASRIKEASANIKKGLQVFASANEIDDDELREYVKERIDTFISMITDARETANKTAAKKPRANNKTAKKP